MHELSVCQSIITQVETIALERCAETVDSITLQIGPLSGVEIPLLESAFSIASAGTVAENAALNIEAMPVRVKCKACKKESNVSMNKLICKHCGDWQTELISGDEMILRQIELTCNSSQPSAAAVEMRPKDEMRSTSHV